MCIINIHVSHGKRTQHPHVLHCLFSIYLLDPEISTATLDDVKAFSGFPMSFRHVGNQGVDALKFDVPSGEPTFCHGKWPSRNSGCSQ